MDKIPKYAYIEAQILHKSASKNLLKPVVEIVEDNYKVPKGTFGNGIFTHTRILSLLYLIIVFPKENWKLDESNAIYEEIQKKFDFSLVEVVTDNSPFTKVSYKFIHHLRNSVSHVRINISEDNIEFWDTKNEKEKYRAKLNMNTMELFLMTAGGLLANYEE